MTIHFTKHAEDKFKILTRHGVRISKSKVIDTIEYPDIIDRSRLPLLIAQGNLDRSHVLRIVYKKEKDLVTVITFYPGRKSQYNNKYEK